MIDRKIYIYLYIYSNLYKACCVWALFLRKYQVIWKTTKANKIDLIKSQVLLSG